MRDYSLQYVFQSQITALRIDGVDILGDVVDGEIFQADRGGHDGKFRTYACCCNQHLRILLQDWISSTLSMVRVGTEDVLQRVLKSGTRKSGFSEKKAPLLNL